MIEQNTSKKIARLKELNSACYQFEKVYIDTKWDEIRFSFIFADTIHERLPSFTITLKINLLSLACCDIFHFRLDNEWLDLAFFIQNEQFETYRKVVKSEKLQRIIKYVVELVEVARTIDKYNTIEG